MLQPAAMPYATLSSTSEALLLTLQALQVAFLATHDWLPLGRLNNVTAVRREDTSMRLLLVTCIQTAPFAFGLAASVFHVHRPYPGWLRQWLRISYALLLLGQLRAWWLPYLLRPEPTRAARYRRMFAGTHAFLPERNGLTPNTAHVLLHVATMATLVVLFASCYSQ